MWGGRPRPASLNQSTGGRRGRRPRSRGTAPHWNPDRDGLDDMLLAMMRYVLLPLLAMVAFAQTDWPSYGNDPGAMRYSSLRQIDAANVERLKAAWTFRAGKPGSEAVPIVVDGVMYITAPDGIYALM